MPSPPTGLAGVQHMIDTAEDITEDDLNLGYSESPFMDVDEEGNLSDPPPLSAYGASGESYDADHDVTAGGDDGYEVSPAIPLPSDIQITPLGRNGKRYYFLNSDGQVIEMVASDFSANGIAGLLDGNTEFMRSVWANTKGGWDSGLARDSLIHACNVVTKRQGVFSLEDRERGRGAWAEDNPDDLDRPNLVVHLGDEVVMQDGQRFKPGMIGDFLYQAAAKMPRPHDQRVPQDEITRLLAQLSTWNFRRNFTGPRLMLGWIAMGFLGGAFPWRPHVYILGGSRRGKSTLLEMIKFVFGGFAIEAADTTEAGLASALGVDTRPVICDEFEAEEDNRKLTAVIHMLRRSSSGGVKRRGSSNHQSHKFIARSPFLMGGIIPPPLKSQDLNRIVMLELDPLSEDAPNFEPKQSEWQPLGQKLFRRMIDGWESFPDRYAQYSAALAELGHDKRGQKTFGTLLACADIALSDEPPTQDVIDAWLDGLAPEELVEYEGASEEWEKCCSHVLQSTPAAWRGEYHFTNIGALIYDFVYTNEEIESHKVKGALGLAGLGLSKRRGDGVWELFFPSAHKALKAVFEGSHLKGDTGGGWVWALRSGRQAQIFPDTGEWDDGLWRPAKGDVARVKLSGIKVRLDKILPKHKPFKKEE